MIKEINNALKMKAQPGVCCLYIYVYIWFVCLFYNILLSVCFCFCVNGFQHKMINKINEN